MTELVIMRNKSAVTTSLVVAEVFGKEHKHVLESIKNLTVENSAVRKMFAEGVYKNERNREYPMYYMNRDGFSLLVMGYTGKEALKFKLSFIDQYNRMEEYITNQKRITSTPTGRKESFEMALTGVEYAARILRTDTTSNIKMLEDAHKEFGVTTAALPDYVDEEVTRSLTSLLNDYGKPMSAIKANNKLIQLGLLEIKERPSTKGTKEFKALTEAGLYYGKNLINPRNNTETQPHYYESKFEELLEVLGVSK